MRRATLLVGLPSVDLALLVIRVVVGVVFIAHGAQKVFDYTLPGVRDVFMEPGIPLAALTAPAVSVLELIGGLALILGVYTRSFAAILAVIMLGALVLVHWSSGFFLPHGIEFVLVLLGAAASIAIAGPGRHAIGRVISSRRAPRNASSEALLCTNRHPA